MPFFDDLPAPEADEYLPRRYVAPPWRRVPHEVVPTVLPVDALLHRSDEFALMLEDVVVYPTGFTFAVKVVRHPESEETRPPLHEALHGGGPNGPSGAVRMGLEFADGRRVAHPSGHPMDGGPGAGPPEAVIIGEGGGGSQDSATSRYWAWPLPTAGDLTMHFRWTDAGLDETAFVLDGDELRAAAAACREIWPGAKVPETTETGAGWSAYGS